MDKKTLTTEFASPEREDRDSISGKYEKIKKVPFVRNLLDSYPDCVLVLNKHRQIVMANDKMLELLNKPIEYFLALRPGEAFSCIHSGTEGGCGTTKYCKYCGAVNTIENTRKYNKKDVQECQLIVGKEEDLQGAYNLRIWTAPMKIENEEFTIFVIKDIADEKFKENLEKIFYHDILNTASGIKCIMELWPELIEEEKIEMQGNLIDLSGQLTSEIKSHRDLLAAEKGELELEFSHLYILSFLENLYTIYKNYDVSDDKKIKVNPVKNNPVILTDEIILGRIIGNLLKNALEASLKGQTVTVNYETSGKDAIFSVHNESVMPEEVQLQLFNRYYTTKTGRGHGIGTYSVKLLTERYLKGKVGFISEKGKGTTFKVVVPGVVAEEI